MYPLSPLCCRLFPEGCVFKPELLGGQEVTCLYKTPLETNGEETMTANVYYAEEVLRFLNATQYSHRL